MFGIGWIFVLIGLIVNLGLTFVGGFESSLLPGEGITGIWIVWGIGVLITIIITIIRVNKKSEQSTLDYEVNKFVDLPDFCEKCGEKLINNEHESNFIWHDEKVDNLIERKYICIKCFKKTTTK